MKLLQVYNQYRSAFNGEDAVVQRTGELIEQNGGEAKLVSRSSRQLEGSFVAKANAFWSGIYSRAAYREMQQVLREDRPDIVHIHNLYPLFSPSILVACREQNVPVVMSVHNQQLTCPTADHLHRGQICEKCTGGHEYHCVLQNCRGNLFESVAYAARSAVARRWRLFHDNVTLFIALSRFAKSRLVSAGFAEERIEVLPNSVTVTDAPTDPAVGHYIAFAGRMSTEKGVDTLCEAAGMLPGCVFRLAGDGPQFDDLRRHSPSNVVFVGRLSPDEMTDFYRSARCVVLPSRTYEMCPLVILEAMSHGLPVVASRLGAQAELVDDEQTGLLCEPGNPHDLASKLKRLWHDATVSRTMGTTAYEQATRLYSDELYYGRLISVYERAIKLVSPRGEAEPETFEEDATLVLAGQGGDQ